MIVTRWSQAVGCGCVGLEFVDDNDGNKKHS
jgi:hypothetical protein